MPNYFRGISRNKAAACIFNCRYGIAVILVLIAALRPYGVQAQVLGGSSTFAFLEKPWNAHLAGIGGVNVSVLDRDPNMFLSNPALLNKDMSTQLSVNINPWFAGTANSAVTYAHHINNIGTFGGGINWTNYGTIRSYDPSGNYTGDYTAGDYAITAGYSRQKGPFSLGLNLKFIGSAIENYSANAFSSDLGALFKHPTREFTVGLTVRNLGFAFNQYTSAYNSYVPLNVQLGTSYKLEHMPLRFSLTLQHLERFDVSYLDGSIATSLDANGSPVYPKKTVFDKIFRHFVFGGEFILGPGFKLMGGWSILPNREMKLTDLSAGAGLSIGTMIRIKAFEFAYSHAWYGPVGGSNYLTLTTNFGRIFGKKLVATEPIPVNADPAINTQPAPVPAQ
ncbi:MAG: type IX secretion system protein PorQ [Bacteroidota bacterium]